MLVALLVRVSATASWMYRGGYLLAALAAAAVIAAGVQPSRNLVRAALSPTPLRAVGKVSYGLYLWHWPIYLAMTEDRVGLSGMLLVVRSSYAGVLDRAVLRGGSLPIRHGRWPRPPRRASLSQFG